METNKYEMKKNETERDYINSVSNLFSELNQTNLVMDKIRKQVLELLDQQELVNKQIDEIKSFVWKDILEAKTEDGKNVYTNDKSRDIAKLEKLSVHKGYNELNEIHYKNKTKISELENNLIFQKNKFRILLAMLEVGGRR
jgi:hypothetical protein